MYRSHGGAGVISGVVSSANVAATPIVSSVLTSVARRPTEYHESSGLAASTARPQRNMTSVSPPAPTSSRKSTGPMLRPSAKTAFARCACNAKRNTCFASAGRRLRRR